MTKIIVCSTVDIKLDFKVGDRVRVKTDETTVDGVIVKIEVRYTATWRDSLVKGEESDESYSIDYTVVTDKNRVISGSAIKEIEHIE